MSYLCRSQARVNAEGSVRKGIQYKTYKTNQMDIDMDRIDELI